MLIALAIKGLVIAIFGVLGLLNVIKGAWSLFNHNRWLLAHDVPLYMAALIEDAIQTIVGLSLVLAAFYIHY